MPTSISNKPNILFIDDSSTVRKTAVKILEKQFNIIEASNGKEAFEHLKPGHAIDLIFADIQMPEMNGLQFLQKLRTCDDRRIAQLQVVMITGHSDSHAAMKAVFDMGATGFISKPFTDIDLISRAHSHLTLKRMLEELEKLAGIDELTGLYNLSSFKKQGDKALSMSVRHRLDLSVVYFEIDTFSSIKEKHGKKISERLLIEICNRLSNSFRDEEILARIDDARFALLLPMTNRTKARIAVNRVQQSLEGMAFNIAGEELDLKVISGLTGTGINNRDLDFDGLCERAEHALQLAYQNNKSHESSYDEETVADPVELPQHDDKLTDALMHIIEGEYNKVSDEDLTSVMQQLQPFMEYAEVRTSGSKPWFKSKLK